MICRSSTAVPIRVMCCLLLSVGAMFTRGLVSIPVNWDYSIPYGLLYSINPDKDVIKLVEKAKKLQN